MIQTSFSTNVKKNCVTRVTSNPSKNSGNMHSVQVHFNLEEPTKIISSLLLNMTFSTETSYVGAFEFGTQSKIPSKLYSFFSPKHQTHWTVFIPRCNLCHRWQLLKQIHATNLMQYNAISTMTMKYSQISIVNGVVLTWNNAL